MKQMNSDSNESNGGESPSQLIDSRTKDMGDWRGATLARLRALIQKADPEVVEEMKWANPTSAVNATDVR